MNFKRTRIAGQELSFKYGRRQSTPLATRIFIILAGLFLGIGLFSFISGLVYKGTVCLVVATFSAYSAHKAAKEKEISVIDKSSQKVTIYRDTKSMDKRKQFSFAGAKSVILEHEFKQGINQGYSLLLEMADSSTLTIGVRMSRIELHNIAEAVSSHLQLPLFDRSLGIEIARPPDRLDESVRQSALRRGAKVPLPEKPINLSCVYHHDKKNHRFVIGAPGFVGVYFAVISVGVTVTILLIWMFIAPAFAADEPTGLMLIGLPMVLLVLYYLLDAVQGATSQEEVVVSKNELAVTRRGFLGDSTEAIPGRQIEELNVVHSQAEGGKLWTFHDTLSASGTKWELLVRSDKLSLHLGRHLPKSEIDWMRNVIEHVLAS